MTTRKWAAIVELFFAGATLLFGVSNLLKPPELPHYNPVSNAFLYQYGKPLSQLD